MRWRVAPATLPTVRLLVCSLLVLGGAGTAHAGDEQWQVTLVPAYAVVDFDARSPSGVGAAAELGYGLSDAWTVRTTVVLSAHPADADKSKMLPEGTLTVLGGFAGLRYAFDVLKTVPYLDLGLGFLWAQGAGGRSSTNLSYEAAIGFDHLESPRWSWGLQVAYHGFLPNYSQLPVYLYAGPTFAWRWE